MPWEERSLMDVRLRFVQDVHRPGWSVAEVSRRYQVSRKTGYKWLERYGKAGPGGLVDRSHRPYSCPHATPAAVVEQILGLQRRYRWGARKVRWLLAQRVPIELVPTVATVHRILERHGRTGRRRRAHHRFHAGRPDTAFDQPNVIWTADFKGQFRECPGATLDAVGVVGAARHSTGADRARASGAERAARAHAQDAQGRDRAAATAHARRSAAAVRLVPAALQHRAAARSARPAPARAPVPRVAASLPHHALADHVSGALCSAAGESQRWHSLGQSLGEREPRARGTRRGFRGNR